MAETPDPTSATDPALRRRVFVGASGAAALAIGSGLAASGADDLGKPHPPFVPADDPAIAVARPTLESQRPAGAASIGAYAAEPRNASAATPGVVVVMAVWGVDAQLRDVVRRFAKAGYRTVAPDLYAGAAPDVNGSEDYETFRPLAAKLADDAVDADIAAAANYLRGRGPGLKVGVTGFCMGGSNALRQTVDNPRAFSAAAVWYGKVRYGTTDNSGGITPIALAYADEIAVPLLGSYGGRDTGIKADDVRALDRRLTDLKKPHDIKIYDEAGHAFFDDTRKSYVASAATDAWSRTVAWFDRYLR